AALVGQQPGPGKRPHRELLQPFPGVLLLGQRNLVLRTLDERVSFLTGTRRSLTAQFPGCARKVSGFLGEFDELLPELLPEFGIDAETVGAQDVLEHPRAGLLHCLSPACRRGHRIVATDLTYVRDGDGP